MAENFPKYGKYGDTSPQGKNPHCPGRSATPEFHIHDPTFHENTNLNQNIENEDSWH